MLDHILFRCWEDGVNDIDVYRAAIDRADLPERFVDHLLRIANDPILYDGLAKRKDLTGKQREVLSSMVNKSES